MTKRFDCREYFVADSQEIAEVTGMSKKQVDNLLHKATKKFEKLLKERLGTEVTIHDIIASFPRRGDYEPMQSL